MTAVILIPLYIILNIYILHRLTNALKGSFRYCGKKRIRVPLYIIYGIFAFSPIVGFLMPYGTELKRFSQRAANYWFALLIYALIVVTIGHLLSLVLRRVFKIVPMDFFRQKRSNILFGLISLVLIVTISGYGLYHAREIKVTDYSVTMNKVVKDTDKMKVVLLADLHMGYSIGTKHIEKTVDLVNSENPDLVIIAGDIYDNDYDALENPKELAKILASIKSKYGTYACWGNHDVNEKILSGFTFNWGEAKKHDSRMIKFLKDANINLLADEVTLVDNKFYIAGRLDRDKPATENNERKSPEELLKNLDKSKPIITIYHEPDEFQELADAGTDLLLCGHTHDGQIFPGNIISYFMWENSYGYLKKDNMHNIVTSGVGVYGPYLRLGTDAEICSIDVTFK